jgi:hypothetical protein
VFPHRQATTLVLTTHIPDSRFERNHWLSGHAQWQARAPGLV